MKNKTIEIGGITFLVEYKTSDNAKLTPQEKIKRLILKDVEEQQKRAL